MCEIRFLLCRCADAPVCSSVLGAGAEVCPQWAHQVTQMCECAGLSPCEARCEGSRPLQNQCLCMSGLMEGPHQLHREEKKEEEKDKSGEGEASKEEDEERI